MSLYLHYRILRSNRRCYRNEKQYKKSLKLKLRRGKYGRIWENMVENMGNIGNMGAVD